MRTITITESSRGYRLQEFVKDNPKTFKELKSMRFLTQTFGDISGAFVELAEFESLVGIATYDSNSNSHE